MSILNAMASPETRRKKTYLNSRSREKGVKVKRASDVKESISKFLDSAQTEDLIFNAGTSPKLRQNGALSSSIHVTPKRNRDSGLASKSAHPSKAINISPLGVGDSDDAFNQSRREIPFGGRTSVRKSPSHVKPKLKRKHPKRRPENKKKEEDEYDDDDLESFAVDDGDEDVVSISSDEGLMRSPPHGRASPSSRSSHQRHSSRSSRSTHSTRQPPSRSMSYNSKLGSKPPPSRSSSRSALRRSKSMRSSRSSKSHSTGNIATGLGVLDRQSRRDRMKQDYRSRHSDDDDDGGGSVVSTMSIRSRKNSGLEGGALNAFLGDENIARNASRGRGLSSGATVMTSQADEKFMRARKSRQDLIMDVAKKEKWQHEAKAREEAEMEARMNNSGFDSDSSDEEDLRFGKKKGMIKNLKRAVRKSAKVARSGAKGSVNVVKDPKRAAKKVGGFAKDVGKETTKMVKDPTLAAKRTAKGVKGTVKLTTKVTGSVAKGSYGVTKTIAKTGVKGTSKVVGKTIHGATGLFVKKDGDSDDDENNEYDPSALRHRRKQNSLVSRFGDDETARDKEMIDSLRNAGVPMRTPDILAPSIDLGGGGSWDV